MRCGILAFFLLFAGNALAEEVEPRRSNVDVRLPDVTVRDQQDEKLRVGELLSDPARPILVQFIFTSCPTICPALAANFSAAQKEFADQARFVSVSIDPEHDTPARLADYAKQFRAGKNWSFVTGARRDIAAIQKAFGVYQGNKMWHAPLTFFKTPGTGRLWTRVNGMLTPKQMGKECDRLVARANAHRDAAIHGRTIYQEGVAISGHPIGATLTGGVKVEGKQFACASCHRPSGFGSSEGLVVSPPVTAKSLFAPREQSHNRGDGFRELFQEFGGDRASMRDLKPRPAYTRASFAHALRNGMDPSGRKFDSVMPRYALGDADMNALFAHLKTLAAEPDPGVNTETIRFAVVLEEKIEQERRQAVLEVARAYVRRKNLDTAAVLGRRDAFSLNYKDELVRAYRHWKLDEWILSGDPESWTRQLEKKYAEAPVFALVGGIADAPWAPIHQFCSTRRLPCFFPITDLPVLAAEGGETLYFSRGLALEGEAMGAHLSDQLSEDQSLTVFQIYRDTPEGRALSSGLRRTFKGNIKDRMLATDESLAELDLSSESIRVLWLPKDELSQVKWERPAYTSGGLSRVSNQQNMRFTFRQSLPGSEPAQIYRARAWLRSRGISKRFEQDQLSTWFAWAIVDHALVHLVENFSRDYLIEVVEHETENQLNPGVYPVLSLGPGQRFASKGCWIVKPSAAEQLEAVSAWITPSS